MRKYQSIIISSSLVLLAACTPQAAAVTPTAIPATEMPPSPTSTTVPTTTPTLEPSLTATETVVPTETPILDWESLSEDEKMQVAITAREQLGVANAVAFVYDTEAGLVRTEDGRNVECPYNINDIWNGENLEKYVGKLTEKTEIIENWGAKLGEGEVTIGKRYIPIIWGETMSTYEEMGISTLVDGGNLVTDVTQP